MLNELEFYNEYFVDHRVIKLLESYYLYGSKFIVFLDEKGLGTKRVSASF